MGPAGLVPGLCGLILDAVRLTGSVALLLILLPQDQTMNRKLRLGRVSPDQDGFSEGWRGGWCVQGPLCSPGLRFQVWEGLAGTEGGGDRACGPSRPLPAFSGKGRLRLSQIPAGTAQPGEAPESSRPSGRVGTGALTTRAEQEEKRGQLFVFLLLSAGHLPTAPARPSAQGQAVPGLEGGRGTEKAGP